MKKVILIIAVFMTSLAVNAQSTEQNINQKGETYYSFAWGLFKSENYPKDKAPKLEIEKPKIFFSSPIDTTKYEQKSALWGAIQWTEKKKNAAPLKQQANEQ
ncbi:MAG: hypothetical protein ACOVSR_09710 [Bacteroidia bacterium]